MKRRRPLGQHFLADTGIAGEIIHAAGVSPGERVVEIGPGKGILTDILLRQGVPLTAIEIDPRLCNELDKRFGSCPDFQLVEADALKYDYSALAENFKVISNLPYYAATPILKRLIRFRSR
ncbi:MAG: ribosomal RNA small subunit methyltransferase A, partial [Nitrospinales bacterium]